MSKNTLAGSLLLLAALGAALAGERPPTYRTPEEVFEAAKMAARKEDWKGVCATLTDDSRDLLAGALVLTPLRFKARAKLAGPREKDILAKLKPLDEVLARHGLSETVLNNILAAQAETDPREAIKLPVKRLLAPIRDRCAFIADMFNTLKKVDESKARRGPINADAELKDVKIKEDRAAGVIVTRTGGKEQREPIAFRRVQGSWKMELTLGQGKPPDKTSPPEKGSPPGK
jgi:hypothetical protein